LGVVYRALIGGDKQNPPVKPFRSWPRLIAYDGLAAGQQKREPTKLECGLLGALLASIVLAFFFWLGLQLSLLQLMVP
jgi:hypothetical protein